MSEEKRDRLLLAAAWTGWGLLCLAAVLLAWLSRSWQAWWLCGLAAAAAGLLLALNIVQMRRRNRLLGTLERMREEPLEEIEMDPGTIARHMGEREILEQVEERLRQTSLAETLKTEAELHALQNQINPHFLYNTLEIIRSRALTQGNKDVAEMAEALALQFRYCINRSGDMAALEQELENVHNYLLIQRYRYGSRFSYEEEFAESAGNAMGSLLPVMTLQPLVENALVHGINPKIEGGTVRLRVSASENRLHIAIEDDGVGIPPEQLRKLREQLHSNRRPEERRGRNSRSMGIALDNVNQRIRHCFGEGYGVDLTSTQGSGTTVNVTLPLIREKK